MGLNLLLDKVPCRETEMTPYEMMLSETQERMLMIIKPEKKKKLLTIFFRNGGLDAVEIGKLTDSGKMELFYNNKLVGTLPIKPLADLSPEYDRPSIKPKNKKKLLKKNQPQKLI